MTPTTPVQCDPASPREPTDREPKAYTKGGRAMIGKRFGYKSARRAGKVHLRHWLEETTRPTKREDADDAA